MKLGPYEVLGEVGRGGMGVVYRARSPSGGAVAIKLLQRADEQARARFDRERRLLAELGPGFVPLIDAGETKAGPYLVMPFVSGGTLRGRLSEPLPVDDVRALGIALAKALEVAHAKGIVHRDMKPENVLFGDDGTPLIADLGIAKHWKRMDPGAMTSVQLSRPGEMRGTPGYMAPEQIESATNVDHRADIYALGAILYEALAGRPAFEGANPIDLVDRVSSGKFTPISHVRDDVPRWLRQLVERMLARDPASRPSSSAEVARSLEEARGQPLPARTIAVSALVVLLAAAAVVGGAIVAKRKPTDAPSPTALDPRLAAALEAARGELQKGRSDKALAKVREAFPASGAGLDEARALVAAIGSAAFARQSFVEESDAFETERALGALSRETERRHAAALVLMKNERARVLEPFSREELDVPPLALACEKLFDRALAAPPATRARDLGELERLPVPARHRAKVGAFWLEQGVAEIIRWRLEPKSNLDVSGFIERLPVVTDPYARARAADPSLPYYEPPELAAFLGRVRVYGTRHAGDPVLLAKLEARTARLADFPTIAFIRARADVLAGKNEAALARGEKIVSDLEKLPPSASVKTLGHSIAALIALEVPSPRAMRLAERCALLDTSGPAGEAVDVMKRLLADPRGRAEDVGNFKKEALALLSQLPCPEELDVGIANGGVR